MRRSKREGGPAGGRARRLGAASACALGIGLALAGCGPSGRPSAGAGAPGPEAVAAGTSGEAPAGTAGPGAAGAGAAGGGAVGASAAGSSAARPDAAGPSTAAPSTAAPSAAEFRGAKAASAAQYLAEPRYAQADQKRGALLVLACKACHAIDPGETNDHAPKLAGVIGRLAGSREDFDYSDALKASGIVWTPAAIEAWLSNPANFVPGTKMKFTGFASADDRRDVVAYLLEHAGSAPAQAPGTTKDGAGPNDPTSGGGRTGADQKAAAN